MKKNVKRAVPLLLLFAVSCSPIYDVSYDYDSEADLTGLRTYDWLPIPPKVEADDLVVGRVKRATNAELEEKGFRMAPDDPDFLIAMHVGSEEKVTYKDWGYTYGGYWRRGGRSKYKYQEGTLVLDFVDVKSNQLIWRGQAKGFLDRKSTPEKEDRLVNEAVQKILKNFPPR
jgi:hypothetical protein